MAGTDDPDPRGVVIRPGLHIPAAWIDESFSTSGGPGGQHANRSRTRVELRLDLRGCPTFSEHQRSLLVERFGPELRVVVDDERSQLRNRRLALDRLRRRLADALKLDPPRRPTRPSRGSVERRLDAKRRQGDRKRDRRRPSDD